jgi:hypothetical protein
MRRTNSREIDIARKAVEALPKIETGSSAAELTATTLTEIPRPAPMRRA